MPKILVVCDQTDTAPVWGFILRQQGLDVILETSTERALERWSTETPDLMVLDLDPKKQDPLEMAKCFRAMSMAPLLLFLPTHHETQILEAYAAGVEEVVVKPISPAIFLAKIMVWARRNWMMPVERLEALNAGKYQLEPRRRCLIQPDKSAVKLTNLELQLLHLLMSRPGHIFNTDEIVRAVWGQYGTEDHVLLKNLVYRLRHKIETDPAEPLVLLTWPGGYSFQG